MRSLCARAALIYFALYIFPFPLNFVRPINDAVASVWIALTNLVASRLLGVDAPITISSLTNTGDSHGHLAKSATILAISLLGALALPGLDHRTCTRWTKPLLAYWISAMMLIYGMGKLIQFPPPGPTRLVIPFGDTSRMELLWLFMGSAQAYVYILGAVEIAAGICLLFPRAISLGAILSLLSSSQILLLNLSFNVPVQFLAFHLLLASAILVLPVLQPLFHVLILQRASTEQPLNRLVYRSRLAVGNLVVITVLPLYVFGIYKGWKGERPFTSKNAVPFYGIWSVESSSGPVAVWDRVIFEFPEQVTIQARGRLFSVQSKWTPADKTLGMSTSNNDRWATFTVEQGVPDELVLRGLLDADEVEITLTRIPMSDFPVRRPGFEWMPSMPNTRHAESIPQL